MTRLITLMIFFLLANAAFAVDQPIYRDGDFWIYRAKSWDLVSQGTTSLQGDYEVRIDKEKVSVSTNGNASLYSADILRGLIGRNDAPPQYLPTNISPESPPWKGSYRYKRPGARIAILRNFEGKVVTQQEMSTVAGTFQSIKIVMSIDERGANGISQTVNVTYFYSPETRCVIKYFIDAPDEGKTEIELIDYGPR